MRPKFKQNVAMKVTREQFERDLKEPLEKLGYEDRKQWNEAFNPEFGNMFLHTIKSGFYAWYSHTSAAYHIEDYNPELFLAIAAMTESKIPIVGEWVKSEGFNTEMYSISKVVDKNTYLVYLKGNKSGFCVRECRRYYEIIKPTLEELVKHLGKKEQRAQDEFVLPEKWKVKLNNENRDVLIGWVKSRPDFDESFSNFDNTSYIVSKHWFDNSYQVYIDLVANLEDYTEITFEQFKKHVLNMEFTKDDLKTGMVVELNNGEMSLVLKNTSKGNVLVSYEPDTYQKNFWSSLDCLNYDLTKDVTKVYDIPSKNSGSLNLIWERKEEPKEYIITPEQAKSIIDIACNDWKDKLFDLWGKQIIFKKDITVSYPFYKQMRNAFASSQNELFNEIFK